MYWRGVSSLNELLGDEGLLRLPSHLPSSFISDAKREEIIKSAVQALLRGDNVLIVGSPGTGKTALMFMILKNLVENGFRIGYILDGPVVVTNDHLNDGVILFYDDIPRMNPSTLRSLATNGVKGVIATARKEEVALVKKILGIDIVSFFNVYEIGTMDKDALRNMLKIYLDRENVAVSDQEAIDVVVEKSNGLPVYIWQVIRDLRIKNMPLTIDYARQIPQGMYDYVDDILWRVIGEHRDRYSVLLTLLVMSDLPRFSIHQDVYNAFFAVAKRDIMERDFPLRAALLSDVLDAITRYLAREGNTYSFRLPHDSWADVLKGRSNGLMSAEISKINSLYPDEKRRKLLWEAVKLAWKEILRMSSDEFRKQAFFEFVKNVFGEEKLKHLHTEVEETKIGREERKAKVTAVATTGTQLLPKLEVKDAVRLIKKGLREGNKELVLQGEQILKEIDTAKAHYNLGVLYLKQNEFEKAYLEFQRALELGFGAKALYNLAVAAIALKRFKEAKSYLKRYRKIYPYNSRVRRALKYLKKFGI